MRDYAKRLVQLGRLGLQFDGIVRYRTDTISDRHQQGPKPGGSGSEKSGQKAEMRKRRFFIRLFSGGIAFRDFIFRAESPLAFACQGETDLIGAAVIGAVLACRKLIKGFYLSFTATYLAPKSEAIP